MIIQVGPDAPWWIRDTAATVLVLHVSGGIGEILSGAVALTARKGEPIHRIAGTVFFVSMLIAGSIGAVVSPMIHQWSNAPGGVFACYLALTSWLTVKRPEGAVGQFEVGAMLFAAGIAAILGWLGWIGMHSPHGLIDGVPFQAAVVFAVAAALAATLDLKVIWQGGVTGAQRIARHLWRMCVVMFIATASFFIGQPKYMPDALRGGPILFALAFAPLAIMVIWLIRFRFTGSSKLAMAPT